MKPISNKRRRRLREVAAGRNAYREKFPRCQWPGCLKTATELHEIARGPARQIAIGEICCFLHLCQKDHRLCDDYSIRPLARQLAVKQIADPDGYDLQRFNIIRGRAPNAITQEEVTAWQT